MTSARIVGVGEEGGCSSLIVMAGAGAGEAEAWRGVGEGVCVCVWGRGREVGRGRWG